MIKKTIVFILIALMLACCNKAKNATKAVEEKATDYLRLGFYSDPGAFCVPIARCFEGSDLSQ